MAETWTILKLELSGGAKKASVQHRLADGSVSVRTYAWPATITKDELISTLDALHVQVLAEPVKPSLDDMSDLVGKPREA